MTDQVHPVRPVPAPVVLDDDVLRHSRLEDIQALLIGTLLVAWA